MGRKEKMFFCIPPRTSLSPIIRHLLHRNLSFLIFSGTYIYLLKACRQANISLWSNPRLRRFGMAGIWVELPAFLRSHALFASEKLSQAWTGVPFSTAAGLASHFSYQFLSMCCWWVISRIAIAITMHSLIAVTFSTVALNSVHIIKQIWLIILC